MDKGLKPFGAHLLLFVLIEIVFVFILFREFPETNLLSQIGIFHGAYWVILLLAAYLRKKTSKVVYRFLATYFPVVFHLFIHLFVGVETVAVYAGHDGHDSTFWLIVGVVGVGVLIYRGEKLIHRRYHCDTHHHNTHKHCHDKECEAVHTDGEI